MIIRTPVSLTTIITSVLASVGALNWGLIGMFDFNLVTYLLGEGTSLTKATYIAVGISGLYVLLCLLKNCVAPVEIDKPL